MPLNAVISVVVPIYNVERYLGQCLESLICQTYKNIEIILVDDGSTDKSREIYEEYAKQDKRIKIIKQTNKGVSVARNNGLSHVKGEYVHFVDSDDYLDVNYYENMLKFAANANADIACSGFYFEESCKKSVEFKYPVVLVNIDDKIKTTNVIKTPSVFRYLYKKAFIDKNGLRFNEDISCGEDAIFAIFAIYYANKIAIVPKVRYIYRYNINSIMHPKSKIEKDKKSEDEKYAWAHIEQFAKEHDFKFNRRKDTHQVLKYQLFSKITLMTKKTYSYKTKYYLFGILPIMTIK
jgi:glycosyltransferase involved in cell wall biosynthesis